MMSQMPDAKSVLRLPVVINESTANKELSFSLNWLYAVDPRIFTPQTWEKGRETTIRLRAADGSIQVNVYRVVSHDQANNEIELKDEIYALNPGETESGDQDVSQFGYKFDTSGNLTWFDPTLSLTEHMQSVVTALSDLVTISGSTIQARNYRNGQESYFVSDGTQWIEARTEHAAPTYPAIPIGCLALDQ